MVVMSEKYQKRVRFGLTAVVLFLIFQFLLPLLGPLCLSILVCLLLRPMAIWLAQHTRLTQRTWGIILLFLVTIAMLTGILLSVRFLAKWGISFLQRADQIEVEIESRLCDGCDYLEQKFHMKSGQLFGELCQIVNRERKQFFQQSLESLFSGSFSAARFLGHIGIYMLMFYVGAFLLFRDIEKFVSFGKKKLGNIGKKVECCVRLYLKTELKLMLLIFLTCLTGLWICHIKGAWLIAILIACLDVLPLIGTGLVLFPMTGYQLLMGEYMTGLILIGTYILCVLVRQFLEPKLIGKQLGVPPFLTLLGIYLGVKFWGMFGVIFGPLYVLVLSMVYQEFIPNS